MKLNCLLSITCIFLFTLTPTFTNAQEGELTLYKGRCKDFAKKRCKKVDLADYKSNGQLTVASMIPGEGADLSLIFYAKNDYRVVICAEEHLGPLEFNILNTKGDVLFSNKDHDMIQNWDFSMTKSQRLMLQIAAPGNVEEGIGGEEGCVNLVIAHRNTPPKGFY